MSGNERLKGVQVHRPIIYGSHARLLTEEEKLNAPPGHTHRWTVFLTSAATPPPEPKAAGTSSTDPPPIDLNYIPGGEDDMSYMLKRVVFRLHETYPNPNRMCERPPYQVTETGWGEFTVQIKVTFVPEAGEKALSLQHPIKLHHWGEPIEPPAPLSAAPTGTPGADNKDNKDKEKEKEKDKEKESKPEVKTEAGTPAASGATTEPPATPADSASTSAAPTPAAATPAATATPAPAANPTIASMYPVHAWQYDELVFCDPPANFMAILEEHPPTPLPARNRRPRDQREEHELRTGTGTKKKARPSAVRPSISRAGTATPAATSRAGTPRGGTPAVGTPTVATPVGVVGELGSADVPLEYSLEMEKAEHARLTEIRVRIVEQMDRWRERLIAQERELTRLKEDMRA